MWRLLLGERKRRGWEDMYYQDPKTGKVVKFTLWSSLVRLSQVEPILGALGMLAVLVALVVIAFTLFQLWQVCYGRTTNEFIKWADVEENVRAGRFG
jgi:hypothetical protein